MSCRACGCDEAHACPTAAGPCWWVLPDLCSRCVLESGPLELVLVLWGREACLSAARFLKLQPGDPSAPELEADAAAAELRAALGGAH